MKSIHFSEVHDNLTHSVFLWNKLSHTGVKSSNTPGCLFNGNSTVRTFELLKTNCFSSQSTRNSLTAITDYILFLGPQSIDSGPNHEISTGSVKVPSTSMYASINRIRIIGFGPLNVNKQCSTHWSSGMSISPRSNAFRINPIFPEKHQTAFLRGTAIALLL